MIKSLGSTFAKQKWISGGAILSDGNIGLIIDIGGVLQLSEMAAGELHHDKRNIVKNEEESLNDRDGEKPESIEGDITGNGQGLSSVAEKEEKFAGV
ncbi:MAG TPA: hypothetical protein ENL22_07165 [candidate division Zixibacteria bacterium]|nr:hypothetical protein [candidate division Zixibacteria bacterium]